ncbi:hypothetical protein Bpfe_009591 [Biomphalaria pfeifferi]|uniref:Uncharacterized protein n=1 Tax=Biomphalaria pfeifferi TaxID=112525 RepID=A0AAD8BUV0_BIOPF|nr:hypothetical protein Bpfe_009591 [Biomphalaria pfeifferi]
MSYESMYRFRSYEWRTEEERLVNGKRSLFYESFPFRSQMIRLYDSFVAAGTDERRALRDHLNLNGQKQRSP